MKSKAPIEKKKIVEINASETISGLGEEVVKILDAESGESICYIGHQNEEHRIFFSRPIGIEEIDAVRELVRKKKFSKALVNGKIKKAQKLADKKFV
jgi:hypothetical protein